MHSINEQTLIHDEKGLTFNCVKFMVFESMKWKKNHMVTVKRLHSKRIEGGSVDLLISELEILR